MRSCALQAPTMDPDEINEAHAASIMDSFVVSSPAAAFGAPAAAASASAARAGAQQFLIRGVTVEFPYAAYECQQVYMEKVIQAVQLSQHALLESPTGTGKCWGAGTRLLLSNGASKAVEDIVRDHRAGKPQLLLGDDSQPRLVVSTTVGHTRADAGAFAASAAGAVAATWPAAVAAAATPATYEVCITSPGSEARWTCNEAHLLVLQLNRRVHIRQTKAMAGRRFELLEWQLENGRPVSRTLGTFATRSDAVEVLKLDRTQRAPLQFHSTAAEFTLYPLSLQRRCRMFRPLLVHFPHASGDATLSGCSLRQRLQQHDGAMLSDTDIADVAEQIGLWLADRATNTQQSSAELPFAAPVTLLDLLRSYDLLESAKVFIPQPLLADSPLVRASLLRGLLRASAMDEAVTVAIRATSSDFLSDVVFLARSIGVLATRIEHDIERENGFIVELHGPRLFKLRSSHFVATSLLPDAAVASCLLEFRIRRVPDAAYFGFEVAAPPGCLYPGRLLMDDFVVTHNTLCLLCATLAWRKAYVAWLQLGDCPPSALQSTMAAQLQIAATGVESSSERLAIVGAAAFPSTGLRAMTIPTSDPTSSMDAMRRLHNIGTGGGSSAAAAGQSSGFGMNTGERAKPKILYSSRTHSQLAKVMSELKHTRYRPKVTILGSRQQLCVHPVVSQLEGVAQTHACRALTADHQCSYYEHLPNWSKDNTHLDNAVLDIEDLMVIGREQKMCPYFYSRERMADAELILLPYNYLIDGSIRNRLGLSFDNAILIADEAHNLEGVCGDSASFDLSEQDIAQAIQEVQRCIDMVRDPSSIELLGNDNNSNGGMQKPDLPSLAILKAILLELEQLLDRQPLPDNGDGFTQPGEYIFDLLRQCQIHYSNKDMLLDLLEKSVHLLLSERSDSQRKSCALDKLATDIRIIFKGGEKGCVEAAAYYRVHIHTKEPTPASAAAAATAAAAKKGLFDSAAAPPARKQANVGRILSYWCFNPGISMSDLPLLGVRCLLLTSGTLSPMESFAHELKLDFPIRLENPHVIASDQIWVGVLERGPAACTLKSDFKSRDNQDYVSDLGNSLVNLSRIVPDGLLVFFPSYAVLANSVAAWKIPPTRGAPSILDAIQKKKALVIEPRSSGEFAAAISDFEAKLDDPAYKGAVFFAVCRGKVSEGLDFADRAGRAVVVTGLPYPAFKDPKVRLKRAFLDAAPRVTGLRQLSGQEWYSQQAARAINQAIGRVIRHRHDYGAIILADARFGQTQVRAQLSRWIRPYVNTYASFGTFAGGLARFFNHAAKAFPETNKRSKGDEADDPLASDPSGCSVTRAGGAPLRQAGMPVRAPGMASGAYLTASSSAAVSSTTVRISRAALQQAADAEGSDNFLTSFHSLHDGLQHDTDHEAAAPIAASSAVASAATANSLVPPADRNPTLPPRAHPTSMLLSMLKPAHSSSALDKHVASTPSAASSNRLLRMTRKSPPRASTAAMASARIGSSATPIKIEMEEDDTAPSLPSFSQQLSQGVLHAHVKREGGDANVSPSAHASAGPIAPPSSAPSSVKVVIKRIKQALQPSAFALFKTALAELAALKATESTTENFMQRTGKVHATVQLLVSLLCGFDGNVLHAEWSGAAASAASSSPPLSDAGLTASFATHIPSPFRPHYDQAVARMRARWPGRCGNHKAEDSADTHVSDNKHRGSGSAKRAIPLARKEGSMEDAAVGMAVGVTASSGVSGVKRERPPSPSSAPAVSVPRMAATTAVSSSSSSRVPAASSCSSSSVVVSSSPSSSSAVLLSQSSFVASVKATLAEDAYARFRQIIVAIEAAAAQHTHDGAQEEAERQKKLALLQELDSLLGPSLMTAYARLMPIRVRATFAAFVQLRESAAQLKWTASGNSKQQPRATEQQRVTKQLAPLLAAKRAKLN